jgi:hypothetical protein
MHSYQFYTTPTREHNPATHGFAHVSGRIYRDKHGNFCVRMPPESATSPTQNTPAILVSYVQLPVEFAAEDLSAIIDEMLKNPTKGTVESLNDSLLKQPVLNTQRDLQERCAKLLNCEAVWDNDSFHYWYEAMTNIAYHFSRSFEHTKLDNENVALFTNIVRRIERFVTDTELGSDQFLDAATKLQRFIYSHDQAFPRIES